MNLIENDENVIKKYESSTNGIFKEICLTSKRLYYSQESEKATQTVIVEIQSIDSIQNKMIAKEKSYTVLMLFALLLIVGGIALLIALGQMAFLAISAIGVILFIIAAVLSTPKYHAMLIIGAKGLAHQIEIDNFSTDDIEELQKRIFQQKNKTN